MPGESAFALESDTVGTKNKKRGARKFGDGDRGFQVGSWPRHGPFEIFRAREKRDSAESEKGRTFYIIGYLAKRKAPPEGWPHWLLARYGHGTYRVSHHNDGKYGRGLIDVPKSLPPLPGTAGASHGFDEDGDDGEPRDNPPMSAASELLEQMNELEALKAALGGGKAEPSVLETFAKSPVIMQLIASVLAPKPNPPAAPTAGLAAPVGARPGPDPMLAAASFARQKGLTPEQLIDLVHRATTPAGEVDEDGEDDGAEDEDDEDDGPGYGYGGDALEAIGG